MARHKVYRRRSLRVPITGLRNEFAMQLYTALTCLAGAPSQETFNALAAIFNVVQLAIEHDARLSHEARLINGGAAALNQAMSRICAEQAPHDYEIAQIHVGVNTIDATLGRLDVDSLYAAMRRLHELRQASVPAAA